VCARARVCVSVKKGLDLDDEHVYLHHLEYKFLLGKHVFHHG
jgi:hypothetical protein